MESLTNTKVDNNDAANKQMVVQNGDVITLSSSTLSYQECFRVELLDKKLSSVALNPVSRLNLRRISDNQLLHLVSEPTPSIIYKQAPPNRNNIFVFDPVFNNFPTEASSSSTTAPFCSRIRTLFGKDTPTQTQNSALYLTAPNNSANPTFSTLSLTEAISEIDVNDNMDTIFYIEKSNNTNSDACNDNSNNTSNNTATMFLPVASGAVTTAAIRPWTYTAAKYLHKPSLRRFVLEGYLQLSNLIPIKEIQKVRKILHHQLGQVGGLVPGAIQGGNFGKFGGEMTNHPALRDLIVQTPVLSVLEELLGGPVFNTSNLSCQIAFRFPEIDNARSIFQGIYYSDENEYRRKLQQDLYFMDWHTDGARQGYTHPFSLLVGICLNDVNDRFAGNLTVWPTSHWLMHGCKHPVTGAIDEEKLQNILFDHPSYTGMRRNTRKPFNDEEAAIKPAFKKEDMVGHTQLYARAGDVVILHGDLAHEGAPNWSDEIREMVYFRIKPAHGGKTDVFQQWEEISSGQVQDIWFDLQGVKNQLGHELEQLSEVYRVT